MLGFRVWDTDTKTMVDFYDRLDSDVFFCSDFAGNLCHPIIDMPNNVYDNESDPRIKRFDDNYYVAMQSTGLKDAYGKIIYEKDILMWRYGQGPAHIVESIPAFLHHLMKHNKTIFDDFSIDYIIVGNIFENADILKQLDLMDKTE
jgi:hypothetical protein